MAGAYNDLDDKGWNSQHRYDYALDLAPPLMMHMFYCIVRIDVILICFLSHLTWVGIYI